MRNEKKNIIKANVGIFLLRRETSDVINSHEKE